MHDLQWRPPPPCRRRREPQGEQGLRRAVHADDDPSDTIGRRRTADDDDRTYTTRMLIDTSWWSLRSTTDLTAAASSLVRAPFNSETDCTVASHCVSCGSRVGDQAAMTRSGSPLRWASSRAQAKASAAGLDPSVPTTTVSSATRLAAFAMVRTLLAVGRDRLWVHRD
jgi:hypothetical protein